MQKILLSLLLSFIVFASANAQGVHVSGKITNEAGEPMDLVHVRLSKGSIGTLSNFKGEYNLKVPQSDSIRIIFTSLGYKRVERVLNTNIEDEEDKTIRLDVMMKQNSAVISDVEVTTNQRNTNSLEKIDSKLIKNTKGASGNAVEDMLGTMAGVTSNNELSSGYSVRGGSFDENLIYINGIEIYRPQLISSGQQEGLSAINPAMVGSIGFSTGGFAPEYGDKMSSVLDITYRKPEKFEASAEMSLLGASASIGQKTKRFSHLHGARFKRNASLLSSLDTKGEYDPRFFDYQTFLTFDFNKDWSASFLGNIAINHYNFTPKTRETAYGTFNDVRNFKVYFDGHEKDRFDTYFGAFSLSYKGLKNTNLQFMVSAFKTNEQVTSDISGEYWLDKATEEGQGSLGVGAYHQHIRNYLMASVLAFSLKGTTQVGKNKIGYGVSVQSEKIDDRISEWERRDSSGYTLPHLEDQVQMIYNLHSSYKNTTTRVSAFLQDNVGWNALRGRFYLIAGVRFSYWSFNKEALFSPRASLSFYPDSNPQLSFRIATGLYCQTPFYKEYRQSFIDKEGNTMIEMNKDIKSQRSFQVIVGSDYTFKAYNRPFKFSAEAYYKTISNYIPYTIDNVQIKYLGYNSGSAYATGLDLKLFGEFVDGTDSWLTFSLMQSKENYNGLKTSRPTEQRYSIGLFFSDFWPGNDSYKFFLRGIFNDGLPFHSPLGGRESGIFRSASYKRIDLGASRVWNAQNSQFMARGKWRKVKEMSVGIDIFNLFDFDNINSYYWISAVDNVQHAIPNYLTGRTFSVSLGVKF
ncbi:MAG: carboxypeptidase-like regulatory domain-containing protein [Bacteroidales bacterium]|nr:carboxypeptidase-like regulatory domain-containing protein [Bacteroidales bacterium]